MSRSDIKITLSDRLTEVSRELTMRWAVYQKQVSEDKLSRYEANKRYLVIQEYKELLKQLERVGFDLPDLMTALENIPGKDQVGRQTTLELNF